MRLTREEMQRNYPNQCIGIDNIIYKDNDGVTVESADVIYTNKPMEELLTIQFDTQGRVIAFYTGKDTELAIGMAEVI